MTSSSDAATPIPELHAFDVPLARLDAVATIDLLDRREVSVAEVVAAAIERAERLDPQLGAVAFERFEAALAGVRRAGGRARRGGFGGLPTFIKDMVPVAGLPMTWGSVALAGGPPQRRTRGVAADIEAMGMVVLGSSTMPEWGFTSSTEFPDRDPTRNPWNPTRSVGGSSGGAAALVASGVVPIAHAADGGGSIRIPAACAGLVGLKPTLGRLRPHADEAKLPVAMTVDGIVSRTVRDHARWYAEMERTYRTRALPPVGEVTGPPTRRLRIGRIASLPGLAEPDEATAATLDSTAHLLEDLGHPVEDVSLPVDPHQFRDDFIAYFQFLVFMAVRTARVTHGPHVRTDQITAFTRGMAADFARHPRQLVGATRRLRAAGRAYATVFDRCDLLLTPIITSLPPELGHLSTTHDYDTLLGRMVPWIAFGPLANATGTPAISLPMGFDADAHLPIASMLSAARGEDALLLQVALELEDARPWPLSRYR